MSKISGNVAQELAEFMQIWILFLHFSWTRMNLHFGGFGSVAKVREFLIKIVRKNGEMF